MDLGYHRFSVGEIECASLSDGSWDYPLTNLFANVPLEQIQEALLQRNLPVDYITTPYTHLYVNTGEHRLLVDTGAGEYLAPRTGKLLHSMAAAGIDPTAIDTIVITHAHPDHIGGALDDKGKPVYAGASYFIAKEEWSFWFSGASMKAPEKFVHFARRVLGSLQDRLHLLEGEAQVVPGIHVIPAPGHTPGHIAVEVSTADASLLYIGDTALHPLHLEYPEWYSIYDTLPEESAATKRRIFDRAASQKTLVMAQHFAPFPSLGTVIRKRGGWLWKPAETAETLSGPTPE